MLEDGRAVLPKESGQPDEDDFATVPLDKKVAKIKLPKPSEVTSLQLRATSGLASEDTAFVTATFVKVDGTTKKTVSQTNLSLTNDFFFGCKKISCPAELCFGFRFVFML